MGMAETERFLLNRIYTAIEEIRSLFEQEKVKSTASSCFLKWFNFNEDFNKLKDMIQKETEAGHGSLHYLYYLNSETDKWLKLLFEPPHHCNNRIPCFVCKVRQSMNKITQEIQRSSTAKDDTHQRSFSATDDTQYLPKVDWTSCLPKDIETYRWSSPAVVPMIYGNDDKIMIMERLLGKDRSNAIGTADMAGAGKDSLNAIGIAGMAGAGKTALCQVAFNNPQVKKMFFPRIWVCLSKQPREPKDDGEYPKEVVKRMLMCLGFEEEIIHEAGQDCDLRTLLMALRQQLTDKRYLIVLDDVWNSTGNVEKFGASITKDSDEYNLAFGLPKGHGAMVIVTSRYGNVARTMVGEDNMFYLLPLADKGSCLEIYKDAVQRDGEAQQEGKPILEKLIVDHSAVDQNEVEALKDAKDKLERMIVNNCDGLPLLAKMTGKIVSKLQRSEKNT